MKRRFILSALTLTILAIANAQTEFRHITFEEAKEAAKAENKMIFVDFYTQWCGPCKKLAKEVFPSMEVGNYLNSGYVCLKLDAEAEGHDLAKSIKVTAYPTIAVFNPDGKLMGRFEGFKEGSAFISAVKEISNPELKPEVVEQKYLAGDRTPEVVQTYVRQKSEKIRNYDESQKLADEIITEYYNGLNDQQKLDPENLFVFSTYTKEYTSPRFKFLLTNIDKFKALSEEAVNNTLDYVFTLEALDYMSKNRLEDSQEWDIYQKFKEDAEKHGFSNKLKPYLNFAENRKGASDEQYIAYCDNNFTTLDGTGVYYLITSLPEILDSSSAEGKKRIDDFLRRHLAEMDASNIYSASMVLMQLENPH